MRAHDRAGGAAAGWQVFVVCVWVLGAWCRAACCCGLSTLLAKVAWRIFSSARHQRSAMHYCTAAVGMTIHPSFRSATRDQARCCECFTCLCMALDVCECSSRHMTLSMWEVCSAPSSLITPSLIALPRLGQDLQVICRVVRERFSTRDRAWKPRRLSECL